MKSKQSETPAAEKLKRPPKTARRGNTGKGKQPKALATANAGVIAQAAVNRLRAFELRCQRKTYRQIAEALGVSLETAFSYVSEHWSNIRKLTDEKADMLRQIELESLDRLQERWEPLALHPDLDVKTIKDGQNGPIVIAMESYDAGLKAVDRVLKIQERRAKLLGLDKPEKVEHSGEVSVHLTRDEWKKRMREARE